MKKASGQVISAFRKHLSYKQEFVANKLNITIATLANIENGRVGIDIEKLYLVSKVFRVPVKTLMELIVEVYQNGCDDHLNSAVKQLKNLPVVDTEG